MLMMIAARENVLCRLYPDVFKAADTGHAIADKDFPQMDFLGVISWLGSTLSIIVPMYNMEAA